MSFVKRVATASQVERGHVQKVLEALREVLKDDLQEKGGKVRIPGLLCASVCIVKEQPPREKKVFGKVLQLERKPSRKTVRLVAGKKLRDLQ
jgi:nucleoid DNA-binding protein